MSFLPMNEPDKLRKQREYKAALDAQLDFKQLDFKGGRIAAPLPTIKNNPYAPSPKSISLLNNNKYQFSADDRAPAPPSLPISGGEWRQSEDPRVLLNQIDKLTFNLRSSDEVLQSLQVAMVQQENRFRQEVANMGKTLLQFTQESDEKVDRLVASLKLDNDKLFQTSRSNVQVLFLSIKYYLMRENY